METKLNVAKRRIWPTRVADGIAPSVAAELCEHPFVVAAFAEADRILTAARAKATQKIAESFAAAVRDRHNRTLRTGRPV